MKRRSYCLAAVLFVFIAAAYICDMSLYSAEAVKISAENTSAERGIVFSLQETIPSELIVNINTADMEELISLPQIGEVRARAIIEYRERYGGFISVDELSEVEGISENLLQKIRSHITV